MDNTDNEIFELLYLSDACPKYEDVARQLNLKKDEVNDKRVRAIKANKEDEWLEIDRLKTIVRNKKDDFGSIWQFNSFKEFYYWHKRCFKEQQGKCFYCKTLQENVAELCKKRSARSGTRGGNLEVERKESAPGLNFYNSDNCVLCCYVCNNAKSDLFTQEEFQPIAEKIAQSIQKALSL